MNLKFRELVVVVCFELVKDFLSPCCLLSQGKITSITRSLRLDTGKSPRESEGSFYSTLKFPGNLNKTVQELQYFCNT